MRQPKWNRYEVALLIEMYWKIKKEEISKQTAVTELSEILRTRAKIQSIEIDETFRNKNGINMRLGELEYLFSGGNCGLKNTSKLFRKMVNAYKEGGKYQKILAEVKGVNDVQEKIRQQFCEWLTIKAPEVQFDSLCHFLAVAEEFCLKIKVLNLPLFETTDVDIIKRFAKTINQNKIFRIVNKKHLNHIVSAANFYYTFVIDLSSLASPKSDTVQAMPATETFKENADEDNNKDFDTSFLNWLDKAEKMAAGTCRSYVSAIHTAESYAKEHNFSNKSITGVDCKDALSTISCLMTDEGFRTLNQNQHNRFSAAFQKLEKYFACLYPDEIDMADTTLHNTEKIKAASKVETELAALLKTSSKGISKENILTHFSNYSTKQVNRALTACHAVKVLKMYYHKDNISDYDDMADILLDVLTKQFAANGDYTSAQQLYNDAHFRLDDFFFYNNAFESRPEVFDLAVHLFTQEKYKGHSFLFLNGMHIWKEEPNYPKDFHGLLIKYGREHRNVFTREQALSFFESIGSATPDQSFSNILFTSGSKSFLQYAENCFVLKEALRVNDNFLNALRIQIENLLESEDYIAFGEIDDYFYTTLPAIPANIQWSPLLLEDVLRIFDIGHITIEAGNDNDKKTIAAAILKKNSPFRTFSDVVWNEVSKAYSLPKELTASEFREFLLDKGFIHGSEKMWNVHKTVAGDLRFYWTEKNSKVTIN